MHHAVSSSAVVDLQAAARGLARRLASLRYFLDAARELLNYIKQLSFSEFRGLSEQIISLMELAGATLVRAGIRLHLFTSCETSLLPYKSAYYELLGRLRHNRHNIELTLRDRMSRLLFALDTRFLVSHGDASHLRWPTDADAWSRWRTNPVHKIHRRYLMSSCTGNDEPEYYASLMPPPDAFPPGRRELSIDLFTRGRSSHRDSRVFTNVSRARSPSSRRPSVPSSRTDSTSENTPPSASKRVAGVSRRRRSFGIFCTGKKW